MKKKTSAIFQPNKNVNTHTLTQYIVKDVTRNMNAIFITFYAAHISVTFAVSNSCSMFCLASMNMEIFLKKSACEIR